MKTVRGVNIYGYGHQQLALDLDHYCLNSLRAALHIQAAGAAGATIQMYRDGGRAECEGNVVHISRDACLGTGGMTSAVYVTETVLFELKNAINAGRYATLKGQVRSGAISLLQYGLDKAHLEFESTEITAQILNQVQAASMPLSPWGRKQIEGYGLGRDNFADQAHDVNGIGHMRLPTKLLYPYEHLQNTVIHVRNMKMELKKVAIVKKDNRVLGGLQWGRLMEEGFQREAVTPADFLVQYIDALRSLSAEPGWTVTWDGDAARWLSCVEQIILMVPVINHNLVKAADIKRQLIAVMA